MDGIINWDLIRNPINWAIVWLMVVFGAILITVVWGGE